MYKINKLLIYFFVYSIVCICSYSIIAQDPKTEISKTQSSKISATNKLTPKKSLKNKKEKSYNTKKSKLQVQIKQQPVKKLKKAKRKARRKYFYIGGGLKNDRVLAVLSNKEGPKSLNDRPTDPFYFIGYGFRLYTRIWPQFELSYFPAKDYTINIFSSDWFFTILYSKKFSLTFQTKFGLGIARIAPAFSYPILHSLVVNIGMRLRYNPCYRVLIYPEYQVSLLYLKEQSFTGINKVDFSIPDLQRFSLAVGYRF